MSGEVKIDDTGYRRLRQSDLNIEGCINLIEAFLILLRRDYATAIVNYHANKADKDAEYHYNQLREFFLCEYFHQLTGLDGSAILSTFDRLERTDMVQIYNMIGGNDNG